MENRERGATLMENEMRTFLQIERRPSWNIPCGLNLPHGHQQKQWDMSGTANTL